MDKFKVLIDTNVFITSEDYKEVPSALSELLRIIQENHHSLLIHPSSLEDVKRDRNEERKKVMLSKVNKYPLLDSPPSPDQNFLARIGRPQTPNDKIDADLLYAVYRNCVNFLVTDDRKIQKKAENLEIAAKVLTIESALVIFKRLYERKKPKPAPFVARKKVYELDLNDPFFDDIKRDYPEFPEWFGKISREHRDCLVYEEKGKIRGLLILKEEEEEIRLKEKILPKTKRLKICTLKVERTGFKIGEFFLKIAFNHCVLNDIFETYLTLFTKTREPLANLLGRFGFLKIGEKSRKDREGKEVYEDVYLKKLRPEFEKETLKLSPANVSKNYYPSFVDSKRVKKFIVPIRPEFHDRLFPDYPKRKQMAITDFTEVTRITIPGNAIDKMYLCHSKITRINPGDIILFYRSEDQKQLTTLGVVEVTIRSKSPQKIIEFAGERTVYSVNEINEMSKKPTLCVRFRTHFYLKNPIQIEELIKQKIIIGAPQSIMEIPHEKFLWVKETGGINGRFTFD